MANHLRTRTSDLRRMRPHEKELERKVQTLFKKQAKQLARSFREDRRIGDLEINSINKDLELAIAEQMVSVLEEFWELTAIRLRSRRRKEFTDFKERMRIWALTHAALQVTNISNATRRQINSIIVGGIANDLTTGQIARSIRTQLDVIGIQRAWTISRTEVHKAANFGAVEGAKDSDVHSLKRWVAKIDDRTRPAHSAANGQERELDDPFDVDGESVMQPGQGSARNSINCRCTVVFIPQEQ